MEVAVAELTWTTLTRDLTDVGIRLEATVPATWKEIEVEGAVLVVGGRLEDNDQTLVPSVQVRVMKAEDEQSAAAAVTGVTAVLDEAKVLFERTGEGAFGLPETVAEVAHRSSVTNATQISMFRTIFLPDKKLAVSIVGTCGGGASEEARDALRDIVTSIRVGPRPDLC
jgi:hypothetical protein